MSRLIQHYFDATRQFEHDRNAPTLVPWLTFDDNAFGSEILHRARKVFAHQRELMSARFVGRTFGWMNAELRRWQRKNQPALAGIDVLPPEHIAQRRPKRVGLR